MVLTLQFGLVVVLGVLTFIWAQIQDPQSIVTIAGVKDPKAFIYDNALMGIYNVSSCSGAPSCGTAMSRYQQCILLEYCWILASVLNI